MSRTLFAALLIVLSLASGCAEEAKAPKARDLVFSGSAGVEFVPEGAYIPTLKRIMSEEKVASVDVSQLHFFTGSKVTDELINLLVEAKEKGARVRVFMDGRDYRRDKAEQTRDSLDDRGIKEVYLSSERTMHVKAIAINGTKLLMGSMNWSGHALTQARETAVLVQSPEVARHYSNYLEMVSKKEGRYDSYAQGDNVKLLTDGAYYDAVVESLRGAERSVDVSIYHGKLQPQILDLFRIIKDRQDAVRAEGRPFDVRIISNSYRMGEKISKKVDDNLLLLNAVRDMGLDNIALYNDARLLHAKFFLVDAVPSEEGLSPRVVFGSSNLGRSSIFSASQINGMISDPAVTTGFYSYFEELLGESYPFSSAGQASLSLISLSDWLGPTER